MIALWTERSKEAVTARVMELFQHLRGLWPRNYSVRFACAPVRVRTGQFLNTSQELLILCNSYRA
jgi:hypothetical protein